MTLYGTLRVPSVDVWVYFRGQAGDHGGAEYTIDVLMGNSRLTLLTTLWFT